VGDQRSDCNHRGAWVSPACKKAEVASDMTDEIQIGDRVQIFLSAKNWRNDGWFDGKVVRIDPYSEHRSFYWVELDEVAQHTSGTRLISVLNPKNIRKI